MEITSSFIATLLSLASTFPEEFIARVQEIRPTSITVAEYNVKYTELTVYLHIHDDLEIEFDGCPGKWTVKDLRVGDEAIVHAARKNGITADKIIIVRRSPDVPFQWALEESVARSAQHNYEGLPSWAPRTALYLGDKKYLVRERAQHYLMTHPREWRSVAWLLTNSTDAEILMRAREIKEFLLGPKCPQLY